MQAAILYRLAQNDAQLKELSLNGSCMGTKGALQLASSLRSNSNLTVLRIPMNFIGSDGLAHLLPILTAPNCKLVELDLSDNDLSDEGCVLVAEILKFNRSLHTLKISDNEISDSGMSELIQALRFNSTLRNLNVSGNLVTDRAVIELCQVLPQSSLKNLDLSSNHIADEGAVAVALMLSSSVTRLENVQLDNNRIGDSGASELRTVLRRSRNAHLQLSFDKVSPFKMDACAYA